MSFAAMAWAASQKKISSGEKLVLIMLADRHNNDTGQCNPSHQRLSEDCCMSEKTVRRCIDGLVAAGLVKKINVVEGGIKRTNQYILTGDPDRSNLPYTDRSNLPGGTVMVTDGGTVMVTDKPGSSEPVKKQGVFPFRSKVRNTVKRDECSPFAGAR
jgi:hypothetical protein